MKYAVLAFLALAVAVVVLERRRRRLAISEAPTLSTDWRSFIESPAAEGEPVIPPAKVPKVRELKAVRADLFSQFRKRRG